MELLRISYVDYSEENGTLIARATGRNRDGDRRPLKVKNTSPFIFVPEDEKIPDDVSHLITSVEEGYESFDGNPVKKLNLDHPQSTNDVTPFFTKHYESDIPYCRRLALDGLNGYIRVPEGKTTLDISEIKTDVEPEEPIDPKIAIADIEVKVGDDGIEEMKDKANMPVLCISLWENYGDSYYQFVLDDGNHVDGQEIRNHLENHWSDEYTTYSEADVTLVRCESEEDLLNSFITEIRNIRPDVISGWNFIDFDWIYLLKRMVNLDGVNPHRLSDIGGMSHRQLNSDREDVVARCVDGLPAFDMMEGYLILIFKEIRSKALDYVAHKDLGIGKVEGIDINKTFEEDRSKLVAYNLIDSQLCVAIDEANDIFGFFFELSEICNIPIWDTVVPMRRIDGYILSRREDDEILPAAEEKELPRAAGALVFEPPTGILDWVGVHDLASLYPSTIISWNISPETVTRDLDEADLIIPDMPDPDDVDGQISEEDVKFSGDGALGTILDEQGVVPKYLNQLFPMRDEKKRLRDQHEPGEIRYRMYDNQQYAVKVVQNIGFGVLGNKYWRLSDKGLADAVTGGGRYVIWKSSEIIRDMGYELLAGDTDSLIVSLGEEGDKREEVLERGFEVEESLNHQMDQLAEEVGLGDGHPYLETVHHGKDGYHLFSFEFEKLYEKFLQAGKKKRYAGSIVWKEGKDVDEIDITGFEFQRSDVPSVAAEAQKSLIEGVLRGKSFENISESLRRNLRQLLEEFSVREHGIPSVLNQPIEEYPNRPVKRATRYSNEYLGYDWAKGSNPFLVYVDETPPQYPPIDVIAVDWSDELPEGFSVDYSEMENQCFKQPLDKVLSLLNWKWKEVKTGKQSKAIGEGEEVSGNPFKKNQESNSGISDW